VLKWPTVSLLSTRKSYRILSYIYLYNTPPRGMWIPVAVTARPVADCYILRLPCCGDVHDRYLSTGWSTTTTYWASFGRTGRHLETALPSRGSRVVSAVWSATSSLVVTRQVSVRSSDSWNELGDQRRRPWSCLDCVGRMSRRGTNPACRTAWRPALRRSASRANSASWWPACTSSTDAAPSETFASIQNR